MEFGSGTRPLPVSKMAPLVAVSVQLGLSVDPVFKKA